MAATFKDFGTQLRTFFSELPVERKIIFLVVLVGVGVGIYLTAMYASAPQYGVLYSNLKPASAASVVSKLESYSIPYKLSNQGRTISVPKNDVYRTRLRLASIGLPSQEGVGFSIFDKVQIGMTDFMQHVDYQRALQGELERTIDQISQVKYSRVLIVLPRQSVFVTKNVPAKASVIIKLRGGMDIGKTQVDGIIHLVASAVEGLSPKNVTIVDTDGKVLSMPVSESFEYTANQLSYVRNLEKNLEHKINSMLVPVVGQGNVTSKVYVKVDFSKKTESQLIYNPDTTAVVSQQTYTSSKTGALKPYGVPGAKSNLPPGKTPIPTGKPSTSSVKKETTNYDVSKKIEKVSYPSGAIDRITASVLVNGTYEKVKDAKGQTTEKYVPRTSSEMSMLDSIVKTAIGYSKAENDKVTVVNVPFKKISYKIPAPPKKTLASAVTSHLGEIIRYGVILIGTLLLILLILKPLMNYITSYKPQSKAKSAEEERLETLTQIKQESTATPEPNSKDTAVNIVKSDPDAAANYIKNLLKETNREG